MEIRVATGSESGTVTRLERLPDEWRRHLSVFGGEYWPAWRPGHDELTTSFVEAEFAELVHEGKAVPGSRSRPAQFLAPRLPHYALWAPDGSKLSYVTPAEGGLSLRVWEAGAPADTFLLAGAPIFPAWHPDCRWLFVHSASAMLAVDTATGEQRELSGAAVGFRTPAVNVNGSTVAWAEVRDGAVEVVRGSIDGRRDTAGRFGGGVALSFRPHSDQLFVGIAGASQSSVFTEVVSIDGPRLIKGPLVGYWWSPDGERLAVLHPSYSGDGRFQVRLYDPAGRMLRAMEPFIPGPETATMVGFFDQYSLSHTSWSVDSRWFGMAGQFVNEGPHHSFSDGGRSHAWAWDTTTGELDRRVDEGSMIAFSR